MYVTLTPGDPEFRPYLLGSFSREMRALPVESFSQHSNRERVTFQLVPVEQIQRPAWWMIYFRGCRPELLGLTLGPFLLTLMSMVRSGYAVTDWISLGGAALGLFFVHVSAFLFNDFRDHMRGVDFANRRRGSQVIQRGWASAQQVRRWAFCNAGLAIACGLPALILHTFLIGWIVLSAAVCVLSLAWMPARLVRLGLADALIFLGLGPLLTVATGIVGFGTDSSHVDSSQLVSSQLWLGASFGLLAVSTLQLRQLENLFRAGRESFRTFVGGFEFDRAKFLVGAVLIFSALIQLIGGWMVFHRIETVMILLIAQIPAVFLLKKVSNAASPLSSDLVHLGRAGIRAQSLGLLLWGAAICFL